MMDFIWKRKKGLATVAVVAFGTFFIGRYAIKRFFEMQEESSKLTFAKENIKKRFEKKQKDSTFAVLALVAEVKKGMVTLLNVEELAENLKQNRNKPATDEAARAEKRAIWETMKVTAFSRAFASLYAIVFLSILIRIQVNVIGRYSYFDSVARNENKRNKLATEGDDEEPSLPEDLERLYMTISSYYFSEGIRILANKVQEVVKDSVGSIPLSKQLGLEDVMEILVQVRSRVERDIFDSKSFIRSCMFPPLNQEREVLERAFEASGDVYVPEHLQSPQFKKILQETRDYIESPELIEVISECMEKETEVFRKNLLIHFVSEENLQAEAKITEVTTSEKLPFPKIIPIVNRVALTALSSSENPFATEISNLDSLEALAAIVYSSLNE